MNVASSGAGSHRSATESGARCCYAEALYKDAGATLDDLHEAATTYEDTERITRRVLGGAHPFTEAIERHLRASRAALRARETPPPLSLSEIEVDMLSLLLDD